MKYLLFSFWLALPARAESISTMAQILREPIDQRVESFRELGSTASTAFLIKTAFDPHEVLQMRWRAITTMGRLDPARYEKEMDRALRAPEWFLRNAALIGLLTAERTRAVGWSIRLLEDPALVVRTQAVRNLIALNAREAEPLLWREIYDHRNFTSNHHGLWIRAHIAEALSKFAGPGRAKAFQRLLMEDDPHLYKWAVNGLEASTGMRLSDRNEEPELRRRKWLARLGVESI